MFLLLVLLSSVSNWVPTRVCVAVFKEQGFMYTCNALYSHARAVPEKCYFPSIKGACQTREFPICHLICILASSLAKLYACEV